MAYTNYRRGADIERRAIEVLKKYAKCFVAHRTAGSHSVVDVFGVNKNSYVYFIQLKRYKKEPTNAQIEKLLKSYTPPFSILVTNVVWMLWIWVDRKGWRMFRYDPWIDGSFGEFECWVEVEPCEKSSWGFYAKGYCSDKPEKYSKIVDGKVVLYRKGKEIANMTEETWINGEYYVDYPLIEGDEDESLGRD